MHECESSLRERPEEQWTTRLAHPLTCSCTNPWELLMGWLCHAEVHTPARKYQELCASTHGPIDLGNGIAPGYRYEVEPSKVQPIRHVDTQLGLP